MRFQVVSLVALAGLSLSCGKAVDEVPPPPSKIKTTYRVLSGVSMGGAGAAALGFTHPERFDAIAAQGGPLDAALLLRTIDSFHLGGFCPLAKLEEIAKNDPAQLNDPTVIDACRASPKTIRYERTQDFNRWIYTTNGGSFSRNAYLNLFTDLTLAYGNLASENPLSPYSPHPEIPPQRLQRPPSDFCSKPIRVKNLYNAEYNPQAKYDAITFCDGQPRLFYCRANQELVNFCSDPQNIRTPLALSAQLTFANSYCQGKGGYVEASKNEDPLFMLNNGGKVDPCRETEVPFTMALAVDINGNGRRDYGEPLIDNGRERFDDVGLDGCADEFEDGSGGCTSTSTSGAKDPNHDNYDAEANPLGAEQNWRWDEGEPYRDFGLDGVASTGDFGEGNAQYDLSSGRRALFAYDARTNLRKMDKAELARIDVLVDGGLRDLFNFGLSSKQVFGLLASYRGDRPMGSYRDFTEIPGMTDKRSGAYSPWNARWKTVPRDLLLFYGLENPTDQDRIDGEGDHVGTVNQAVNRFYTLFNWVAATWPSLEKPSTPFGGASVNERQQMTWYSSGLLKAPREFGIALPPGYFADENKDKRYPVLYMLHGYGMRLDGFISTALITDAYMSDPDVKFRPMILVFPSGACCFVNRTTGARDCREKDDNGADLEADPRYFRECVSGTFYVNRKGYTPEDSVAYGDSLYELMDYVDQTYRTLPAEELEAR